MTRNKILELYQKLLEEGINLGNMKSLRTYKDEDIDIILNSKYPSIMINIIPNYEFKLLDIEKRKQIIEIINSAKNEGTANSIYQVVRSKNVLSSGLTVELSKIICDSQPMSASYAKDVALNVNVLLNKDSLELVRVVGESKEMGQAITASLIAQNMEILMSESAVELTKIASITEGEEQRRAVHHISVNRDVIFSGVAVKLAKLASKIKSDDMAQLIITIACDKKLEKNKRSVYYLTKMLCAETYEELLKIYNEAQKLIKYIKEQETKTKKDSGLFWTLYKNNPTEAISLLKLKVNPKDEVTPYTRVKK